nr:hypothetical protein [uncultured Blautia sp.]
MNKEYHNENKNDEEDTSTLAKLFSNWYVGAVVGFALGTLKGGNNSEYRFGYWSYCKLDI